MTEQTEILSAASAVDAAVDAAVVVALSDSLDAGSGDAANAESRHAHCLNCGALIRGRYCIDCGQTTDTHVPTLTEVAGDAIAALFNLDSRLWRTLGALILAPGRLTQDFLAGKRARYVPPLRLYLVMSVVLFLVASIDRSDDTSAPSAQDMAAAAIAQSVNEDVAADLEAAGIVDANEAERIRRGDSNPVVVENRQDCEEMNLPFTAGGALDSAFRETCLEGAEDDFSALKDAFADNIPLMAFLVIPVMAAVFKLFYLFTGRAYLGHLVLLCHTHAFTFLLIIVIMVLQIFNSLVDTPLGGFPAFVGFVLLLLYMPVYYFITLRRVYAQHWALTFIKLVALMMIYFLATALVFAAGLLTIALTS